jgi:hypothetical protein
LKKKIIGKGNRPKEKGKGRDPDGKEEQKKTRAPHSPTRFIGK